MPDTRDTFSARECSATARLLEPSPKDADYFLRRRRLPPKTKGEKGTLAIATLEVPSGLMKMLRGTGGQLRLFLPGGMFPLRMPRPEDLSQSKNLASRTVLQMMLVHARAQEFRTDPPPDQRLPARAPRTCGGEGECQRSGSGQTRGGHWHERTRDIAVKPRQPNPAAQEPKRGQPDKNLEAAPWNIDHAPSNP